MFVKPTDPKRRVALENLAPDGRLQWVPEDGVEVEDSPFVRRRIADGDLVEADPPRAKSPRTRPTEEPKE